MSWIQQKLKTLAKLCNRRAHTNEYERIENELQASSSSWPPVSTSTMTITDVLRIESQQHKPSSHRQLLDNDVCDVSEVSMISNDMPSDMSDHTEKILIDDRHIELENISQDTVI